MERKERAVRLEDFISWAREGKEVLLEVSLAKRHIVEKVLVEVGSGEEIDAYLLAADFDFRVNGTLYQVSKVYVQGYTSEPLDVSSAQQRIANARLKTDYKRLAEAGVVLEKKFFEEFRI